MRTVEISSLPDLLFSHIFKRDSFHRQADPLENFIEITYISEGTLTCTAEKNTFSAKKGDVVCSLYNTESSFHSDASHCHHTVCAKVNWNFTNREQGLLLPAVTYAENNTATICHLIDEFVYNQILYKTSKINGAAKFLELLCAIDQCNRKTQKKNLTGELLYAAKTKDYIQRNVHLPIKQSTIAEQLGVSPEYLCAVFKKAEGTTIMQYINRIKLENIKTLIDNTDLHLYEAAAMYGYNDPNYVSKLYKQMFGYSITSKPQIFT